MVIMNIHFKIHFKSIKKICALYYFNKRKTKIGREKIAK